MMIAVSETPPVEPVAVAVGVGVGSVLPVGMNTGW